VGISGALPQGQQAAVRQYEIRWATLPAPIGRRPVLLLTRTPAYNYLNKVIVAEVTTTVRGIAQEVPLGEAEGLRFDSVANLDNVHVIARSLIGTRLGELPHPRHREVKRALGHVLGWSELQTL
jgi:mRNA interferase MazF